MELPKGHNIKFGRNHVFVAVYLIAAFVLLTRLDYVVNGILYRHGLTFSSEWYNSYILCYALLWQLAIIPLCLWQRNTRLFLALEVIVNTWLQDLIYFLLWTGGLPTGEWTWMLTYKFFGTWTSLHQIIFSLVGVVSAIMIYWKAPKWFQ